jgi:hypothetical protein
MVGELNGFCSLFIGWVYLEQYQRINIYPYSAWKLTIWFDFSLVVFRDHCYEEVRNNWLSHKETSGGVWFTGPGFKCFAVCAAFGFIRCLIHWVTPLPKMVRSFSSSLLRWNLITYLHNVQGRGFLFMFTDFYDFVVGGCKCTKSESPDEYKDKEAEAGPLTNGADGTISSSKCCL